jgi:colanic acid/amylovoran biosynthesis protein
VKIVVSNTAALNGGDAAILYATVDTLSRAFGDALEVTAADMQAEVAARYHPGLRFCPTLYDATVAWAGRGRARKPAMLLVLAAAALGPFAWRLLPRAPRRALEVYAAADAVVSAGGTYLVPHYELMPKLFDFLVTLALGRPLILFTQSLGPFYDVRQRRLLRFSLRRARLVLVRDERSVGHLRALGVAANVRVAADAAFALADPARAPDRPDRLPRAPKVAISVRDWPHFRQGAESGMVRYRAAIAAFAAELARRGATITFVSTCQGIPDYWTDDSAEAERIAALVPDELRARIAVDRDFRTPARLIERLAGFDLVVATRMHAAILALCAGTHVLPIAYEFKTRQLFARLGLDDLTLDADTLTGDSLIAIFDRYAAALPRINATLWSAVGRERQSALALATVLAELLGRRSARDQRKPGEQDGGAGRANRHRAPESAQREREADADHVQERGRDDEARGIAGGRGRLRQLEAVGMAVEDREGRDDDHRRP